MIKERSSVSFLQQTSEISSSRVAIRSAENTTEHTLPIRIRPLSNPITNPRRSIETQTATVNSASSTSKSVPSFADTQLLSVYYLNPNTVDLPASDRCVFVEQQERQPIRARASYDPLSSTKSTQTSLTFTPLSTQGSTFLLDPHQQTSSTHNQHYRIHSGSQLISSDEPMPDSDYSYEEYTIDVHTQRPSTPSTSSLSSSSITTVIAQNEDRTVNHQSQPNGRVSSWPPIPDEILRRDESPSSSISKESNSQSRPSRVQFAEQLIRVIPASATNSLTNESLPMTSVPPGRPVEEPSNAASRFVREQLPPLDHPPINQSRWVQDRMDRSETRNAVGRVGALRSVFEQPGNRSSDSSTVSSPTGHYPRQDPDEKPSKHGDEFRFRIEQANGTSMHHAEPVKVIQKPSNGTASVAPLTWEALLGIGQEHAVERTSPPFHLDQIRQIIGRPLTSLADAGHYLKVNNHGFVSSINRSLDCSRMLARGNGTRHFGWVWHRPSVINWNLSKERATHVATASNIP